MGFPFQENDVVFGKSSTRASRGNRSNEVEEPMRERSIKLCSGSIISARAVGMMGSAVRWVWAGAVGRVEAAGVDGHGGGGGGFWAEREGRGRGALLGRSRVEWERSQLSCCCITRRRRMGEKNERMREREGMREKVKKQEQPRGRNADSVLRLCQVMIARIQSQ